MSKMNRLANVGNRFQGKFKRVLCVCSAGLLRSPTAALVLSMEPFNFNTRACGISEDYALIVLDDVLLEWAEEIVCMERVMADDIIKRTGKPVICLNIDDSFEYREPRLMDLIANKYREQLKKGEKALILKKETDPITVDMGFYWNTSCDGMAQHSSTVMLLPDGSYKCPRCGGIGKKSKIGQANTFKEEE